MLQTLRKHEWHNEEPDSSSYTCLGKARLFVSLMADAGVYEFAPLAAR